MSADEVPVPDLNGRPRRFRGVYPVLATPFTSEGSIDETGLEHLVAAQLAAGVVGVVCFGLASEPYQLTVGERGQVLKRVTDTVRDQADIVVGLDPTTVSDAVRDIGSAVEAGASAVMLRPPPLAAADVAARFLDRVIGRSPVPVIVQDAPTWTGVELSPAVLAQVAPIVKVEAIPSAPRIRELEMLGVHCLGGYGGMHLAQELDAGLQATMPGSAYPSAFVAMMRSHAAGDHASAVALHERLLPVAVFLMSSLETCVAGHKELLYRAGVIGSSLTRMGRGLTAAEGDWLAAVVSRTGCGGFVALPLPSPSPLISGRMLI